MKAREKVMRQEENKRNGRREKGNRRRRLNGTDRLVFSIADAADQQVDEL